MMKLKQIKATTLKVTDTLPDSDYNLKHSNAYDAFVDGAIDSLMVNEIELALN
jgi:hypothetical protein